MNAGLLEGLGAFLQGIGGNIVKDQDVEREDARMERKARLAAKLQMDLLKAKQEYAKANPTYSHFINTAVGDVVALDQFGNAKLIAGTDEMKQAAKDKADAALAEKKGKTDEASARLGLIAAQTAAANARAGRDNRYVPGAGRAAKPDPHILSPLQWEKAVNDKIKAGNDTLMPYGPNDPEYAKLKADAEASLKASGYRQGFQQAGLLTQPAEEETEDDSFDDLVPQ